MTPRVILSLAKRGEGSLGSFTCVQDDGNAVNFDF